MWFLTQMNAKFKEVFPANVITSSTHIYFLQKIISNHNRKSLKVKSLIFNMMGLFYTKLLSVVKG